MTPSEIKRARQASLLKELISEALGNLNDEILRGVTVTDVVVKKGDMMQMYISIHPYIMKRKEKRY